MGHVSNDTAINTTIINLLNEILENELIEIAEDTNLSLIGMDSLKAINIIVKLEEEFDIEFSDEDLHVSNIETLSKIKDILSKYLQSFTL